MSAKNTRKRAADRPIVAQQPAAEGATAERWGGTVPLHESEFQQLKDIHRTIVGLSDLVDRDTVCGHAVQAVLCMCIQDIDDVFREFTARFEAQKAGAR